MPRARAAAKASSTSARSAKKSTKTTPNKTKKSVRSFGIGRKTAPPKDLANPLLDDEQSRQITPSFDLDASYVSTYHELLSALQAREPQIALDNNIIIEGNILINYNVTIDFNGYSIISEDTHPDVRVLDIRSGEVTLIGQGKVFAMGKNSVAIRAFGAISNGVPNYTSVTVGDGISLFAPDSYGILISPNLGVAYGLTIDFAGQIFARDGICLSSGVRAYDPSAPIINIQDGACITADEEAGIALEAAGYGTWSVGAAYIRGAIGVALSKGIIDINHAQILATRSETFRIMESPDAMLEVNIDGGDYGSERSAVIAGVSGTIKKFSVKGCKFYSPVEPIMPELSKIIKRKKLIKSNDLLALQASFLAAQSAPEPTSIPDELGSMSITAPAALDSPSTLLSEDSLAEQALASVSKPVKHPKKHTKLPEPIELADDATDEAEILSELAASQEDQEIPESQTNQDIQTTQVTPQDQLFQPPKTDPVTPAATTPSIAPAPPRPTVFQPAPQPVLPFTNEQDAARRTLSDAIMDIRKLSADDYDTGFTELEKAIRQAEKILSNPLAPLSEICDAASGLLTAFDGLEEHDESTLSDDELDELFYHGAVLQEMLRESRHSSAVKKPRKKKSLFSHKKTPKFIPESTASIFTGAPNLIAAVEHYQYTPPQPVSNPVKTESQTPNPNYASNFNRLSEVLTTISELDLNKYTLASQEILLNTLAQAQNVLNDPHSSQDVIDELATKLNVEMSQLVPLRQAHVARTNLQAELTAPAPTLGELAPSAMIDEMTPSTIWSLGVTMIDETTPFITDPTTREKMLRAMQSRASILQQAITRPFRKLARSLGAGLRAGIKAYRDTLHAPQNN